jgi:biotin transport system substrate-specific component
MYVIEKNISFPIRSLVLIALLTSLTGLGGFIKIPFFPVPFTLQTLFVYLAGDLLGGKKGAMSQVLFLVIGLAGIPIFSKGGGPAYILQPTFGYLLAFPFAAWVIGICVEKFKILKKWYSIFICNGIGLVIIYLIGVVYLYINLNFIAGKELSWIHLCWSGAIIFLPGDLIKMALAASLAIRLKSVNFLI